MTEMTTYQQPTQAVVLADYQTRAVQRLADWVQSADAAFTVAQRLCESSFVPQQYRGKPVEATAAILAGSEVGLSPMASLRAFDNIQGTAAPKALTLRAIVQSFGHSIHLVESTATRCVMKGRRRGDTEWQTISWTLDQAKDLGLASKDQWKKQPGTMLLARATGQIARLIAADAILGIGYTAEEIADGAVEVEQEWQPTEPVAEQPTTRKMSRPKPAPEPAPADEPPAEDATEQTKDQRRMFALLREKGYGSKESALRFVGDTIGREVGSRSDLTADEIVIVIDALLELPTLDPEPES